MRTTAEPPSSSCASGSVLAALGEYCARERLHGPPADGVRLRRLRGGISSADTFALKFACIDSNGMKRRFACVAKVLAAPEAREAAVYEHLHRHGLAALGPRLLGVHRDEGRVVLLLERVGSRIWPWADERHSSAVLERLAQLHRADLGEPIAATEWCYEGELRVSAAQLADWLSQRPRAGAWQSLRRTAPAIRRLVESLPRLRAELSSSTGKVFIHGDAHPGNALVSRQPGHAVLLDWARARLGSPLEDASSWLMSLGCWEHGARRRHDTLLARYLRAAGLRPVLSKELREAYWLAAASNALAGALLHHLEVLVAAGQTRRARVDAERAASSWLRVLRRAHAVWG